MCIAPLPTCNVHSYTLGCWQPGRHYNLTCLSGLIEDGTLLAFTRRFLQALEASSKE